MGEESEYASAKNGASAARQTSSGTMGASTVPGEGRTEVAEEANWVLEAARWRDENVRVLIMSLDFNKISRAGLDAASVATSIGFTAARLGTRLGVRSLASRSLLVAHPLYFAVLHNTRHHHNRCQHYRLCARSWSFWWTHQRRACSIECCGLNALHYRTNHIGPDTYIRVLDINLVHSSNQLLGSNLCNYAWRRRSNILSR